MEKLRTCAQHCSGDQTLHQEFFKVFMPQTSSLQLRIPKAFTKFFNGIVPSETTLVDHDRNSWDVGLAKIEDRLVFKTGWQKFARAKCLEEGDFLVFEHDGKSTFHVKIFSKTGCRKEAANCGKIVPVVILDDDSDESGRNIQRVRKRKHSPAPRGLKINEKSESSEGLCKRTRSKSKGAYEANVNNYDKAPGQAEHVPTNNPFFVVSFSHWTLTKVEVPKSVLRQWNIKLTSQVSLRDENEKVWPVMVTRNKAQRHYFGDGWSDFRKGKDIEEGHKCHFEFVLGKANLCKELLVRVHPPPKCPE